MITLAAEVVLMNLKAQRQGSLTGRKQVHRSALGDGRDVESFNQLFMSAAAVALQRGQAASSPVMQRHEAAHVRDVSFQCEPTSS